MTTLLNIENSIAFFCDSGGRISRVLRDDHKLFDLPGKGDSFYAIVSSRSVPLAKEFLASLSNHNAAFGWELQVSANKQDHTFYFAGGQTNEGYLVVGAPTLSGMHLFCEDLIRMLNEQTNSLRSALKEISMGQASQSQRDHPLYEEMSRLNNELVTLQRELAKKNHELYKLNSLKTRFLGMASHDLRKPLSVVLLHTGFLLDQEKEQLSPKQFTFVETIRKSSQGMLDHLDDFLDIAQIESGKLRLNRISCNLAKLIESEVELSRPLAEKKSIALTLKTPAEITLSVDERRIRQVIGNLMDNAIKYSPSNTTIQIRVATQSERVAVSVRDEGIGIPPEAQNKLFNAYAVSEGQPTGAEKKTGLGLAIVRGIINEHGGSVWLESFPNKGTTVFFTLPLKGEERKASVELE